MSGPIVRTVPTPEFSKNWDSVFGTKKVATKATVKPITKSAKKKAAESKKLIIEGRDISNQQTLLDEVAEAGLDRTRAEAVLNSSDGLEAIKEAGELSRRHLVDGVPFFIISPARHYSFHDFTT